MQRQLKPLKNRYKNDSSQGIVHFITSVLFHKRHNMNYTQTPIFPVAQVPVIFAEIFAARNVEKCKIIANLSVNNSLFIAKSRVFDYTKNTMKNFKKNNTERIKKLQVCL